MTSAELTALRALVVSWQDHMRSVQNDFGKVYPKALECVKAMSDLHVRELTAFCDRQKTDPYEKQIEEAMKG